MRTRRALAGLGLAAALGLAACGAQSTGELDQAELTDVLVDAGLSQEDATCVAKALGDADLSKDELDQLAEDGKLAGTDADDDLKAALEDCGLSS